MKKLLLIGVLALGFVLTGCGKKEDATGTTTKVYKVGTNAEYEPFEYLNEGKIVGFDIDLMEAISAKAGFKIEFVDMTFDGLIPALQSGKIDILIAAMTVTEDRAKAVNFSTPYNSSAITFITNSQEAVKSLDDLAGKKYGAQLGSTQEEAAKKIEGSTVVAYNTPAIAVLDLKSGKLDSVVVDQSVANKFIAANPDLKIVGSLPADEKALAVSKKFDSEVFAAINKAIEELKKDGTIKKLEKKYNLDETAK